MTRTKGIKKGRMYSDYLVRHFADISTMLQGIKDRVYSIEIILANFAPPEQKPIAVNRNRKRGKK